MIRSPEPQIPVAEDCAFDRKAFILLCCNGQKVDVIEKGFKNAHRFFLTTEDMEKS
jgi:hypothetical protein